MRALAATLMLSAFATAVAALAQPAREWVAEFPVDRSDLRPTGRNDFFVLEPGHVATYQGGAERLAITVLPDTKVVDGVTTRVVEERETRNGKLTEISRNYFAISAKSADVYYFGEDVDVYRRDGTIVHEGAWLAGQRGARYGLMMPARPRPGARFYQEIAPKIAMDRVAVVDLHAIVKTPAGVFTECLKVEETTPLEPGVRDYKYYARGIGLVQDGSLKLVRDPRTTPPGR